MRRRFRAGHNGNTNVGGAAAARDPGGVRCRHHAAEPSEAAVEAVGRPKRGAGQRACGDHLRRASAPGAPEGAAVPPTRAYRRSCGDRSPRMGRRRARTRPTSRGCCRRSMLADANEISQQFSGQGSMWQNPFARPNPRTAVETASVWFTAYPLSLITRSEESFLKAMADEALWKAFAEIGIQAVHTGPVKRAGGISGWQLTPSVDGHFDRISTQIDPAFGIRGRVPADVRHRQLVRRHHHRRHRARPHRQGRGLPAGRDEVRGLPGHLPHGRYRSAGLGASARCAGRARIR